MAVDTKAGSHRRFAPVRNDIDLNTVHCACRPFPQAKVRLVWATHRTIGRHPERRRFSAGAKDLPHLRVCPREIPIRRARCRSLAQGRLSARGFAAPD
jgi:hypothetical protein